LWRHEHIFFSSVEVTLLAILWQISTKLSLFFHRACCYHTY
jgi:hypothetical protein